MRESIYRSPEGEAEIRAPYDEALADLGAGYENLTVATRYGDTHVLAVGSEDAPPVLVVLDGNFLNPMSPELPLVTLLTYRRERQAAMSASNASDEQTVRTPFQKFHGSS